MYDIVNYCNYECTNEEKIALIVWRMIRHFPPSNVSSLCLFCSRRKMRRRESRIEMQSRRNSRSGIQSFFSDSNVGSGIW